MYKLYFLPSACSLATQVVIRELDQNVELVARDSDDNFSRLNPAGTVPVLIDDDLVLNEGAAILFYLLDKHPNSLMPAEENARLQATENILFANATMHPAYGRLFFVAQNVTDEDAKTQAFNAAAKAINALWQVVEDKLAHQPFLGGANPSAADILLAVYQRWGASFPVDIVLGPKAQGMVDAVHAMPSFVAALAAEDAVAASNG